MEMFIDFTEVLIKAVLCKEDNQQYSRDFSALQESKEACVVVGKLVRWVLAVLCVDGVTPVLVRHLSLKLFFFPCFLLYL